MWRWTCRRERHTYAVKKCPCRRRNGRCSASFWRIRTGHSPESSCSSGSGDMILREMKESWTTISKSFAKCLPEAAAVSGLCGRPDTEWRCRYEEKRKESQTGEGGERS